VSGITNGLGGNGVEGETRGADLLAQRQRLDRAVVALGHRDKEKIDHGEGFGAGPLEQDRTLALVAGERGAVEARRPLTRIVEVDHEAIDETLVGVDLKVAAEILVHKDTSASGSRARAARAATSPTTMRLGPA